MTLPVWTVEIETSDYVTSIDFSDYLTENRVEPYPDWIRLDYCKCTNCPMNSELHENCPAAMAIIPLVKVGAELSSIEEIMIRVGHGDYVVEKEGIAQDLLSSLMAYILFNSACPILGGLRRMHLFTPPFPAFEVVLYHALAHELVGRYYFSKLNDEKSIDIGQIHRDMNWRGEGIKMVIRAFVERFPKSDSGRNDGMHNAAVLIHSTVNLVSLNLDNLLEKLSPYFDETGNHVSSHQEITRKN